MPYANKEDRNANDRKNRLLNTNNAQQHRRRMRERTVRRREQGRLILREAKDSPCVDCGRSYPIPVMHFHHARGEEKFLVSMYPAKPVSLDALREEIAKCDVLRPTCHALRHYYLSEEEASGS